MKVLLTFSIYILYSTEHTYIIFRVAKFEYGQSQDWIIGLNLIYFSFYQEAKEEFKVCDFSCLLSSTGGYVGLFFGISLFDLIFSLEWILSKISKKLADK